MPVRSQLARQLEAMGIHDDRVLWAFDQVPRRLFVPPALQESADGDHPLPIGHGQTISQPFVVAYMTERLELSGSDRVLEIGTGSGYQTAILAHLSALVYSVEIIPDLSARAAEVLLERLRLPNVHLRVADGWSGWPEKAPFDRILVTAAAPFVPPALAEQLRSGGRMVLPVGEAQGPQMLKLVAKDEQGEVAVRDLLPVHFVPMTAGRPLVS